MGLGLDGKNLVFSGFSSPSDAIFADDVFTSTNPRELVNNPLKGPRLENLGSSRSSNVSAFSRVS